MNWYVFTFILTTVINFISNAGINIHWYVFIRIFTNENCNQSSLVPSGRYIKKLFILPFNFLISFLEKTGLLLALENSS